MALQCFAKPTTSVLRVAAARTFVFILPAALRRKNENQPREAWWETKLRKVLKLRQKKAPEVVGLAAKKAVHFNSHADVSFSNNETQQ